MERKLLQREANSFILEMNPFQKDLCAGRHTGSHKSCLPCKIWSPGVSNPLMY